MPTGRWAGKAVRGEAQRIPALLEHPLCVNTGTQNHITVEEDHHDNPVSAPLLSAGLPNVRHGWCNFTYLSKQNF